MPNNYYFCTRRKQIKRKKMTKYESNVKHIAASVEDVYAKLCDLENLRPMLEKAHDSDTLKAQMETAGIDASQLEMLKNVSLTSDRIAIPAPMIGEVSMIVTDREENKTVKFETEQSPIKANMWIQVLPSSEVTTAAGGQGTKMRLTLKADLNPMVKMMLGSKLEDGIDKFADMLAIGLA